MAERFLVVAPSWVGDAILSEPLLALLREPYEEPIVDVFAPPWCGPVYARMRGIRRIIENPFGHGGLDIKSYYVGMMGSTWEQTSMRHLSPKYLSGRPLSHNALGDARDQAELFRRISEDAAALRTASTQAEEAS